ncbi:integrase core domain-containing protein [Streptomyces sp. S.PNR 29]|uniref:integrase core domain-containing protein n=1 Tax=Streptomyces sp. S.PNR 29 TaxID=2973805 RepID=UPI0025B0A8EE|nr:integrase core domain-containing protein [Streptomyces sp. S.PNR 29]MDN0200019.1 integrase core domain-containing protein [Streptomyces sp. S.PNR 29]
MPAGTDPQVSSIAPRSAAIAVWNIHYNYHRPHSAAAGKPPAACLRESVINVEPSYI